MKNLFVVFNVLLLPANATLFSFLFLVEFFFSLDRNRNYFMDDMPGIAFSIVRYSISICLIKSIMFIVSFSRLPRKIQYPIAVASACATEGVTS